MRRNRCIRDREHICGGLIGASTVSDNYNKTTYRAGLFAGTTFVLGPNLWNATFGVFGSVDWVPYAAIDNPDFLGDAPSHLTLQHKAQFAVSASITVPLN